MSLITKLEPNDVFVFGSNQAGIHGAGAAQYARDHFGAEMGRWFGRTGQCFAIPTKDAQLQTLPRTAIWQYVDAFLFYAGSHSNHWFDEKDGRRGPERFLVTPIGCGLAGYQPKDIAPMFASAPANVVLPEEFRKELGR